jgi:hypothetical protein
MEATKIKFHQTIQRNHNPYPAPIIRAGFSLLRVAAGRFSRTDRDDVAPLVYVLKTTIAHYLKRKHKKQLTS